MSGHNLAQQGFGAQYEIDDPGDAKAIVIDRSPCVCNLVSAGSETRTLAAPDRAGLILTLGMKTDGGDIVTTVASAYDEAGSTTLTHTDAGQYVTLHSIMVGTDYVWRVMANDGVAGPDASIGDPIVADVISERTSGSGVTVDGMLVKDGGATVAAATGMVSSVANLITPFIPTAVQQALSGAGAVNLTTFYTAITNTGANALTLADSTVLGQLKKVKMIVDPGTDSTLTFNTNATIVFADVGDYALLMWNGSDWIPIELGNDADGATAPVYTAAS